MININQAEFVSKAKEEGIQIIDVRTPEECAAGVVSNSININYMDWNYFNSEIDKLDRDKDYLVYCRSGNRSGKACMTMEEKGFSKTYNLEGGMLGWQGNLEI